MNSLGNILYNCTLLHIICEHLHDLYTLNGSRTKGRITKGRIKKGRITKGRMTKGRTIKR